MIFFELIVFAVVGVLFGIVTGLTPGVHINLVSVIILSLSPFLLQHFNVISVAGLIIAMSITHTFLDFIPSIYLGAPNEETALSILPGHRLLMRGMAYEAVRLTTIGCLFCLLFVAAISPILIMIIPTIYSGIKDYIGWILLLVVVYMILKSKNANKIFWTAVVFLLSGILGLIVLNLNINEPLLPMFSGMFGISMLLTSIFEKVEVPKQRITEMIKISKTSMIKTVLASTFSGTLVSIFPGLGPSQSAVVATQIAGRIGIYSYLVLVGGINTVSMMMALITMFTINKARNGSIAVVQQMIQNTSLGDLVLFILVGVVAGGFAAIICMNLSKIFTAVVNKVNYQLTCLSIICLVVGLVFYFSGFLGLLVLLVSTSIGLVPSEVGVARTNLMGVLLLPVILWYLLG